MSHKFHITFTILITLIASAFITPSNTSYKFSKNHLTTKRENPKPKVDKEGIPILTDIAFELSTMPLAEPDSSICCSTTVALGTVDGKLVEGTVAYKSYSGRSKANGIKKDHTYIKITSLDGRRTAEMFVTGNGRGTSNTNGQMEIIGGIRLRNITSEQCTWCDCMKSQLNIVRHVGKSTAGNGSQALIPSSIPLGPDDSTLCPPICSLGDGGGGPEDSVLCPPICSLFIVDPNGRLREYGPEDDQPSTDDYAPVFIEPDTSVCCSTAFDIFFEPDTSVCCSTLFDKLNVVLPIGTGPEWSDMSLDRRLDLREDPAPFVLATACGYSVRKGKTDF